MYCFALRSWGCSHGSCCDVIVNGIADVIVIASAIIIGIAIVVLRQLLLVS